MAGEIEGGCRCGKIRYRLKTDRVPSAYACHCLDCQTWSGSAFSLNIPMPEANIELTGERRSFTNALHPKAAAPLISSGCAHCFTRVFNTNSARPGIAGLRAGSLDRSDEMKVVAHIWTKRKMTGIAIPDGVPHWPESAPPAEFMALLMQ